MAISKKSKFIYLLVYRRLRKNDRKIYKGLIRNKKMTSRNIFMLPAYHNRAFWACHHFYGGAIKILNKKQVMQWEMITT